MQRTKRRTLPALRRAVTAGAAIVPTLFAASASLAGSSTWLNNIADPNANWSAGTNWAGGVIPGITALATGNAESATLAASALVESPYLDVSRRLGQVNIDNAQADYNIDGAAGTVLMLQNSASGSQLIVANGGTTTITPELRIGTASATWNSGNAQLSMANGFSTAVGGTVTLALLNTSPVNVAGVVKNVASSDVTLTFRGAGSMNIGADITVGATNFLLDSDGGASSYSGKLSLTGNNNYTGTITWRTGTLELGSATAAGSGTGLLRLGTSTAGSTSMTFLISGPYTVARTIIINGGGNAGGITIGGSNTTGTATYSGTFDVANRNGGVVITAATGGTVQFSNTISGSAPASGIVTKVGGGTLSLTNAAGNTYVGGTSIAAGTVYISNTTGSGTGGGGVTVSSVGTFGGTGSASGAVLVRGGGTLLAGNASTAVDDLALGGNLTLSDTSLIKLVLGNGSAHSSLTRSGGTWTFDDDQRFVIVGDGEVTPGQTYDNIIAGLAAAPGTLVGDVLTQWQIITPQWAGTFTYDGANVDLVTSATPEPASLSLLAIGGLGLLRRRRRV